jgi:hypothetical protein
VKFDKTKDIAPKPKASNAELEAAHRQQTFGWKQVKVKMSYHQSLVSSEET